MTAADYAAMRKARPYSLTTKTRLLGMMSALHQIDDNKIPGDIVECGVWRGGNIILARLISPHRTCWAYDTFTGMTEPGPQDQRRSGISALEDYRHRKAMGVPWCAASVGEMIGAMQDTGTYDPGKVRIVAGDVTDSLTVPSNLPEGISLLRLDTDWYASTRKELEVLYPRLAKGGVLIIDDFGHWKGARQATEEYFSDTGITFEHIDYSAVRMTKP